MARCSSCSAPLPANTNRCRYCDIRNDVDLKGQHDFRIVGTHSDRICPHCDIPLHTIDIASESERQLHIDRCKNCFGLFFDPGEMEDLLEIGVPNVFGINRLHLENINKDRYQNNQKVKYIKCPICSHFMSRVNFGHRSGVIIDRCKSHGVWLDSGEIIHLMEWKKAGGQLLQNQQERRQKKKQPHPSIIFSNTSAKDTKENIDFLETVSSIIMKLFD